MTAALVYQTSFNRGELDPSLFARWDWQSYFSGARRIRNMICRTQGGVLKRPGLEFISQTLDPDKPSVFIRFRFAVKQTYMLEFADRRFRVFMDGGVVLYPSGHPQAGREVIVSSPYTHEQMARVRVAQADDVMVFTHPDHQPQTLTRLNHHEWVFGPLETGSAVGIPQELRIAKDGNTGRRYRVSAVDSARDESVASVIVDGNEGNGQSIAMPNTDVMDISDCRAFLLGQGQDIPNEWDVWNMSADTLLEWLRARGYSGLTYANPGSGTTYYMYRPDGSRCDPGRGNAFTYDMAWNEAMYSFNSPWGVGFLLAARQQIIDYVNNFNDSNARSGKYNLEWDPVANAEHYRVYREYSDDSGARFMLLGTTNKTTFEDDNMNFLNSETPQVANNPFDQPGRYPGVCTFYQQRLILARTNEKPNTVWGSRLGAWRNFNKNDTEGGSGQASISDSSAFEHTFQTDEANEILWCTPLDDMLFGTAGGEFRMGGGSYVITPTNVFATRQSNYGCSDIAPVIIGQSVIGVGHGNRVLRAYKWNYSDAAYQGSTLSEYAGHLFTKKRIVSIARQFEPDSIVWVVMSDGTLFSLTFKEQENVRGWCRHDTDGRFVAVSLMSDLEGNDEVWVIVAREINGTTRHYIERMKEIQHAGDDISDAWYVDSGLTRYGLPTKTLGGLQHLEGKKVTCLGDGNVFPDLVVTNGTVTLPREVIRATVGLPYTAELETLELEPPGGTSIAHLSKSRILASVLFYHSRECYFGRDGSWKPLNLRFQTEEPSTPIKPITVRKNFYIPSPIGDNRSTLWLSCPSPVPFGVQSVTLEVITGQSNVRPGKAANVV